MKNLLRKVVPKRLIVLYKSFKVRKELNDLYNFDKKRYLKSSFGTRTDLSLNNLRSKITFHYHSIEKGLSNAEIRLGFGQRAFSELFYSLDKWVEKKYPNDDFRFQSALSVIHSYIEFHNLNDFDVSPIEDKFKEYLPHFNEKNIGIGGYKSIGKNQVLSIDESAFEYLAKNRYSVRDFGNEPVNEDDISSSIQMATKAPSVCNRQAWRVYVIQSKSIIQQALKIQNGFKGNGKNIQKLLLVTMDNQFMRGPSERNQSYIDGGLYAMSLIYALTSKRIATCPLNASFDMLKEDSMRKLINIKESEDFITFIAVGSYPEEFKVAQSPRDSFGDFTTFI